MNGRRKLMSKMYPFRGLNESLRDISDQESDDQWEVSSVATSCVTVNPSKHCRQRQQERQISKKDIQRTLKHGQTSPSWRGRQKKQCDDITVITENVKGKEQVVTTYRTDAKPSKQRRKRRRRRKKKQSTRAGIIAILNKEVDLISEDLVD
eukprot:910728_1